MNEIQKKNELRDNESNIRESNIIQITNDLLYETNIDIANKNKMTVPVSELTLLGSTIASLIPSLRTVTNTVEGQKGLYRIANQNVGEVLKVAKDGNYWGSLKTTTNKSKLAKFKSVDSVDQIISTQMPIDPTTLMMAAMLYSIDKQLSRIEETQKEILSFLQVEKESEIEADLQTLTNITSKYKHNWDNDHFISSNHKMVSDIQRTARKHMISYQKKVASVLDSKKKIVLHTNVKSTLSSLQDNFKYYRLSLYTYSFASLVEVLLSRNFYEVNVQGSIDEISELSIMYRKMFSECSIYLEESSDGSIDLNMLKGLGIVEKQAGKLVGSIPIIKNSKIDEFFQDNGEKIKENAKSIKMNVTKDFSHLSNPGTSIFIDKMKDLVQIYNHTDSIYFNENEIYLLGN